MKAIIHEHVIHPFGPIFHSQSRILILGSFPSVKSREQQFYYGHPRNRFWMMLSSIFECKPPETKDEKIDFLLCHDLALWDVIYECDIHGSSDSSIKNAVPNDIQIITNNAPIEKILCNGKLAGKLYSQHMQKDTNLSSFILPSTSPANASFSLQQLQNEWKAYLR